MKPARRTHVRFVLAALLLLGVLQSSTPAMAQQVGSACSPANKVIYPTYFAGTSQAYVCDGAHLVLLESDTAVPLQKGIGTATPQATLDVNGEVRVGNTGLACSATTTGAMRYNSVNLDVEYCNGTSWTGGSGGVALNSITSATAANTALINGDFAQTWNWALTTANNAGLTLGETTASTATGSPTILQLKTLAASTAIPLTITNGGTSPFGINITAGGLAIGGTNVINLPDADTTSIAIGRSALISQSATSSGNVAVGNNAGKYISTGTNNVAIGQQAMFGSSSSLLVGTDNTAVGWQAGYGIQGGVNSNTAFGASALRNNYGGSSNTAVGTGALGGMQTGDSNVALGSVTGYDNSGGSGNLYLGTSAGANDTGSNSLFVNNVAESSLANDKAYSLLYGTFSGTAGSLTGQQLVINGNVGIGTTTPTQALDVVGNVKVLGGDSYFFGPGNVTGIAGAGNNTTSDYLLFQTHNATRMVIGDGVSNPGNVGIGTTLPTNALSFTGQSAQEIWLERETTANTAGNTLTVAAGGATSAATNKNGGDLILSGGTATGTGSSSVILQMSQAGASGTTDNAPVQIAKFGGPYYVSWFGSTFSDVKGYGAMVWGATNKTSSSGNYETAFGNNTTAAGDESTAMGLTTTASGTSSLALGQYAMAGNGTHSATVGAYSVAMGLTNISTTNYPEITGSGDLGIFMQDQHNQVMSASNTVGVFGGQVIIDPASPATVFAANAGLGLEVNGTVGAAQYCDTNGANCIVPGAGAASWSGLTNPTTALALAMGSDTSTFTYGAATGATSLFKLTDTTGNTGTGYMLDVSTATGSAEKPFHVGAGAINALTVLANGNVGIGTATPAQTLDVNGTIQFSNLLDLSGVGTIYSGSTRAFTTTFNTTGLLDLYKASTNGATAGTGVGLAFNTTGATSRIDGMYLSSGNSALAFQTTNSGTATEWMRILNNGNVGIGTATPKSALDVGGGVAIGSYAGTNAAPSNGLIVSGQTIIGLPSDFPDGVGPHKLAVAGTDGSNVFALENTTATQQFAFYINNGFPASPIQMGSITDSRYGIFTNNAFPQFTLDPNGGAEIGSGYYAAVPPASGLIVQGNVGIGTTTTQATLDVNGYLRLAKNSAQPVACSSTNDGAIALTHVYTLCVCNGGSTSWVQSKDGTTACSW